MAKNNDKRAERMARSNRNVNRAITVLMAGVIAEFYLLMVNNYYVKGGVGQVLTMMTVLQVIDYIGCALFGAGLVVWLMRKKWTRFAPAAPWLLCIGFFFAVSSILMLKVYPQGTTMMCVIVPVVMLIGIVFLLNYSVGHLNFTYGGILDQSLAAGNRQVLEIAFVAAFFGFGVKAAIYPFYRWLPDASVAPTPVSALLHAVAVVKAGAFAVMRLIYFGFGADFLRGTWAQTVVMAAAIVTIVYGSARALRTPHLKRRLAFSTVSNLSYILFAFTIMTPAGLLGGLTHMVYHAVVKITMFCCAGAILHKSGREYVYELENFGRVMPVVFAAFTVSSFALIGLPPLGGFAGKWMIATAAVASQNKLAYVGIGALILSTLLTTLYLMTVVVRAYFPVGKLDAEALAKVHDPDKTMTVPLVLLASMGVVLALCSNLVIGFLTQVSQGLL